MCLLSTGREFIIYQNFRSRCLQVLADTTCEIQTPSGLSLSRSNRCSIRNWLHSSFDSGPSLRGSSGCIIIWRQGSRMRVLEEVYYYFVRATRRERKKKGFFLRCPFFFFLNTVIKHSLFLLVNPSQLLHPPLFLFNVSQLLSSPPCPESSRWLRIQITRQFRILAVSIYDLFIFLNSQIWRSFRWSGRRSNVGSLSLQRYYNV